MWAAGSAGIIEIGIENVSAMWPSRVAIVDNECDDDLARGRFPIGNVFTPGADRSSITTEATAGSATVAATMSNAPGSLIRAMIGRRATHSRRERERSFRRSSAKKARSFIERARSSFRPQFRSSRKSNVAATVMRAQLFDVSRVKSRVLARKIYFPNYGNG
jgi:hypothetical protein